MEVTANFSLSVYSILIKNLKKKPKVFFYCNLRALLKNNQTQLVFFFLFSRICWHEIGKLRIA